MDDDNERRERDLDKRSEQEPAHMHRAPVRVFFFESIGPALAATDDDGVDGPFDESVPDSAKTEVTS